MDGTFLVLLSRPEQLQPDKIAEVLSRFRGVPLADGRFLAKHCWGFLGERLQESEATRLVKAASDAGMEVLLSEESALPSLPPAQNARVIRCAPDALYFTADSGPNERGAPWDRVRLLCAAALKEESVTVKMVKEGPSGKARLISAGFTLITGIPRISLRRAKEVKKVTRETELFLYADLLADLEGSGWVRIRVDQKKTGFTYLAQRLQNNAFANFRLFLQDASGFATGALVNKGARTLLAGQVLHTMGYEISHDYEKEIRWLLALSTKKQAPRRPE